MNRSQVVLGLVLIIGLGIILFILMKKELAPQSNSTAALTANKSETTPTQKTAEAGGQAVALPEKADYRKLAENARKKAEEELSDEDLKLVVKAKEMFEHADRVHDEEKLEMLESLFGIVHPDVIDIVNKALSEDNEEIRLAAVELLDEFESELVIPAVEKALDDKNAEVRETAMNALMYVESPDATTLLVKGVNDKTEEVREVVFDVLEERNPKIKEAVFEKAIHSDKTDVRDRVLEMIVDIPSHKVMNILIEGMKTPDKDFKDEVVNTISFFVSEDFESYDQAKQWWEQNKENYDEELFEK